MIESYGYFEQRYGDNILSKTNDKELQMNAI